MKEHEIRTNVKQNQFRFLLENGFKLIPLKDFKIPVRAGWPTTGHIEDPDGKIENAVESASHRLHKRKNVGAVLPSGVVVVDIDLKPDTDGDTGIDQFEAFLASVSDLTLQDFLELSFSVQTGGGGYHAFFRYDPALQHALPKLAHAGCSSVDVLAGVRFVVTPGCAHPSGGVYQKVETSPLEIRPIPEWLADVVFTTFSSPLDYAPPGQAAFLCGVVNAKDLGVMLRALDPCRYRDYATWFSLLAACHHATNGDPEAMAVFADWSARDLEYATEAHKAVETKWATVHAKRKASKTPATVMQLLSAVGRAKAEQEAIARLQGRPESLELIEAAVVASRIRAEIVASSLDSAVTSLDRSAFADWILGLKGEWPSLATEDKRKVFADASKFDELDWRPLAEAIAATSSGEFTRKRAELGIRKERDRSNREQKELKKQEEQGEKESKLTAPALVELIAEQAITRISNGKDNIGWAANENIYHYENGVWKMLDRIQIERLCYETALKVVDTKKEKARTVAQYSSLVVDTVRLKTVKDATNLYAKKELSNCINLKNGTVWVEPGKPLEFRPHCREDYLTTQLPYDYDPSATCYDFITMLRQVFVEIERDYSEKERDEFIRHFFEIAGYIIQPNKDIPLAWIWVGGGRNGKSRIAKILSKLVGEDAWLCTDIRNLDSEKHPHMMPSSENKLVVLDDDVKSGITLCDGTLKKVSQSTDLLVNPKNKNPYTIRLQLTPLIISNNSMRVDDLSDGMLRRLEVAEWGADMKPHVNSKLPDLVESTQMPGILNMAMQGLLRLRERGHFDPPQCSADFRRRFMCKANTIYAFWESLDKLKGERLSENVALVYNYYKNYVLLNSEARMSLPIFVDNLVHLGIEIDTKQIVGQGLADKSINGWIIYPPNY